MKDVELENKIYELYNKIKNHLLHDNTHISEVNTNITKTISQNKTKLVIYDAWPNSKFNITDLVEKPCYNYGKSLLQELEIMYPWPIKIYTKCSKIRLDNKIYDHYRIILKCINNIKKK